MAYDFASASSQNLSATTTLLKSQSKITLAAWIYRNSSGTLQSVGCAKNSNERFVFYPFTDNNMYFTIASGSLAFGSTTAPTATAWSHVAMVFDGTQTGNTNRLKGYVNGSIRTLSFSGTVPTSTSSNVDIESFTVNRLEVAASYGNGRYCEVGVWQEALTENEIVSLSKGMTCDKVNPQSLVIYLPLIRDIIDYSSSLTITNNGSATVIQHPRIYA